MPLIKKQPAIVSREMCIEAPVAELLGDYTPFVQP